MIAFSVYGVPQPKGSHRAFIPKGWSRAIVTDANEKGKGWAQLVSEGASRALQQLPLEERVMLVGPVAVALQFFFPRPKKYCTPRLSTVYVPMTSKPDIDKIERGVFDALKGVLYRDDCLIVFAVHAKHYADCGAPGRVDIAVCSAQGRADMRPHASALPLFEAISI